MQEYISFQPPELLVQANPATDWLIDIGPFFDRFGSNKIPLLASPDLVVQAIVKDCLSRKWIDLKRPDVNQALDLLVSKNLIDSTIKVNILDSPVLPEENLVLRKLYF